MLWASGFWRRKVEQSKIFQHSFERCLNAICKRNNSDRIDSCVSVFVNEMEEKSTDVIYDNENPQFNTQLKIKVNGGVSSMSLQCMNASPKKGVFLSAHTTQQCDGKNQTKVLKSCFYLLQASPIFLVRLSLIWRKLSPASRKSFLSKKRGSCDRRTPPAIRRRIKFKVA